KFDEMFQAVSSGVADAALAPIENSLAGSIHQNYDLMMEHQLTIIGEVYLHIVHNLIAIPGASLEGLRTVYSHPVALAQCARFFKTNTHIEAEAAYDTAGSVKMIMENGNPEHGAIAALAAAEVYGGQVIVEGVQDNNANYTRFLLLAPTATESCVSLLNPGTEYKTSLVFRVANRPGALFKSLASFALRDLDLCKIESRPIEGRPWEYSFYLDLKGNATDPALARALGHLDELAESVRVLGSYPAAQQ
ncbi:MAG: prephenate dehydratase, partial [Blastocatellia bacterium]